MFAATRLPRVFALPPGVDFPTALVRGLLDRLQDQPPQSLARVHLVVNTARMERRIRALFHTGPARLLPRISLLTDLDRNTRLDPLPPALPPLRRRLELAQLIARLLDQQPDLAARSSLFDLADSLAGLIDEMQGEGVSAETIRKLDVSDLSGHWARAQAFIGIADQFTAVRGDGMDAQARQRKLVDGLIADWRENPPRDPVILAGSTGSRGTTLRLMQAVARLPQGAVILPGFDFDMPAPIWDRLDTALTSEDHPQYRFRKLLDGLDMTADQVLRWAEDAPIAPARNRLVSLALRPAPVTDAWMAEGPGLGDLSPACAGLTLVEAASPRAEALAIALRLRQAAEDGQRAALITPDRMLTRQVAAMLDRWGLLPDDSAGLPLHLSAAGRFLRHVAQLFIERLTGESLLALLKHPLTHAGEGRGEHLRLTRDLELHLRRNGPPFPDAPSFVRFADRLGDAVPAAWLDWLQLLCDRPVDGPRPLAEWVDELRALAETLARGSLTTEAQPLWEEAPGREARAVMDQLAAEAAHGGDMGARDFADLLGVLLSGVELRSAEKPHPDLMIWGTLEARVQGADLLILGGLNEGSWPQAAAPDPWLNRRMRHDAGLLLPERRIGLAAHDFQIAVAAPEVWLTRAHRSDDAETVPSRWLNRILNLLGGLPDQGGPQALAGMRARGKTWLDWAAALETPAPVPPAPRPSPRPPLAARPDRMRVTEVKSLIRDPYAIYARHVLRLDPLDPLVQAPDALLRGIVVHQVLEDFIRASLADPAGLRRDRLLGMAETLLMEHVPWPTARRLWLARLARVADDFLAAEANRRAQARPVGFEVKAVLKLDPLDFTLSGRADRIDIDDTGRMHLIDYKTGTPPTEKQQEHFDKQLLIEAAMAEEGAFHDHPVAEVARAVFLGVGGSYREVAAPLAEHPPARVLADLRKLISAYLQPDQGFTARRALHKDSDFGAYDQLARFGEWDRTTPPTPEDLT